jgi:hypothetical protein
MQKELHIFSVMKVSEGGRGQKHCMDMLKEAGITCERAHSIYVGESGIGVRTNNKRVLKRVERILWA